MNPALNKLLRLSFGTLMILLAPFAMATHFYVSSVDPNRNDANPGTSASAPWASMDKVKSAWGTTIKAGDTVHMAKGSRWTWSWGANAPWWSIRQGGTAGAPITIRGDDYGTGGKPILQRTGGTGWGSMIAINTSYVTIRDIAVDGGSDAGFGTTAFSIASGSGNVGNCQILNTSIYKLGNSTAAYCCGIEVAGVNNYAVSDCLIEGNEISGYSGHGLNHYPQKTKYRTTSMNHRIVWRNNRLLGASPNVWAGCGSAIHIAFGGSGNVFEYNYIQGSHPAGAFMVMNCSNDEADMKIRYNVVRNNLTSNGLLLIFDGNGIPSSRATCDVYGNIFMQCRYSAIAIEMSNQIAGQFNVYNNVFYDNRTSSVSSPDQGADLFVAADNAGLNMNIRNNIFLRRNVPGNMAAGITVRAGSTASIVHNNNLFWHEGGTGLNIVHFRGTAYSVANVKTFEPSAQNADPQFTDVAQFPTGITSANGPDRNGFMPRQTSPAIDRGVALGDAFSSSIGGVARPQGAAWDIGAYEYGAGTPVVVVPAIPSGLTATTTSISQVRLTWQDNSANETGFKVERGTNGTVFTQIATVSSNVTSYVDTGLTLNVSYYYRVRAFNPTGDSSYSTVTSVTPGEIIVDNQGASFTTASGQDAWLVHQDPAGMHYAGSHHYNMQMGVGLDVARWSFAVPTAGTYDVYAWWWDGTTRPADAPFTINYVGGNATIKVDQRINGGKWNLLGSYPFSMTGTVTVSDAYTSGSGLVADAIRLVYRSSTVPPILTAPSAPTGLTAVATANDRITLTWQDTSVNETGFKIERGINETDLSQIATVSSNVTSYVNTGLTAGVSYYYRVMAVNLTGNSGYSAVRSATPGEIVVDDMGPTFTTVTGQDAWLVHSDPVGMHYGGFHHYNVQMGAGLDVARWAFAVPQAGTYDVYAWWWDGTTRPADAPFTINYVGGSATIKVDQRTNGGKWNLLGSYPFSTTGTVTVSDAYTTGSGLVADAIRIVYRSSTMPPIQAPPSAPSGLAAVAATNRITLTWQDNSVNETEFRIERGTNGTSFAQIATVSSNSTQFSEAGLTAGVTYYYRIRAYNPSGNSAYANVASATTPALQVPPVAPTGLKALWTGSNQVSLLWRDNSVNETGFQIERSLNGGTYTLVDSVPFNSTGYVHSGIAIAATNAYRVRAANESGNSAYTEIASIVPGEILVDDLSASFTVVTNQDAWLVFQDDTGRNYGNSHHYNLQPGNGGDRATWQFAVPVIGMYDVYACWWDGDWRPTNAPYTVNFYGGRMTVKVDQRINGGTWNLLGSFPLGETNSVILSDAFSSGSGVVADAIRVMYRPDKALTVPLPPTEIRITP